MPVQPCDRYDLRQGTSLAPTVNGQRPCTKPAGCAPARRSIRCGGALDVLTLSQSFSAPSLCSFSPGGRCSSSKPPSMPASRRAATKTNVLWPARQRPEDAKQKSGEVHHLCLHTSKLWPHAGLAVAMPSVLDCVGLCASKEKPSWLGMHIPHKQKNQAQGALLRPGPLPNCTGRRASGATWFARS